MRQLFDVFQPITIFAISFIFNIWQGSERASTEMTVPTKRKLKQISASTTPNKISYCHILFSNTFSMYFSRSLADAGKLICFSLKAIESNFSNSSSLIAFLFVSDFCSTSFLLLSKTKIFIRAVVRRERKPVHKYDLFKCTCSKVRIETL